MLVKKKIKRINFNPKVLSEMINSIYKLNTKKNIPLLSIRLTNIQPIKIKV